MTLQIVFWDVQHGSATYIKTPSGKHIVQDLGTGTYKNKDEQFSPLLHLKNNWGVKRLDQVIVTHLHKDHIDDIMNFSKLSPHVFARPRGLSKEEIMKGVREGDKPLFEEYFEIDKSYNTPVSSDEDPKYADNNGGASINLFFPQTCSISQINNCSVVTVLSYADTKVVIPGDNESDSWKALLKRDDFKSAISGADMLLAPHHGRESAFYPDLFNYFKPKLTIVSDGPETTTSAVDKYRSKSSGWNVHCRDDSSEMRHCVTTRKDGVIEVKLGYTPEERPFIHVTILIKCTIKNNLD